MICEVYILSARWTKEEKDFLKRVYNEYPITEIVDALGKTFPTVLRQCKVMGLEKEEVLPKDPEHNKICSKCKKELPKTEFYNKRDKKDGLDSQCKKCAKESKAKSTQKRKMENTEYMKNKKIAEEAKKRTAKEYRTCTVCGKKKLGAEFYFDSSHNDRMIICIECDKTRVADNKVKKIKKGESW